jgi:hypothetical protein
MKIKDIINERAPVKYSKDSPMDKHYADSLGRVDTFHHPEQADKTHTEYRMMLAAAESDGTPGQKLTTDANSFAGVNNFAIPYTDEDAAILDAAYKHLGVKPHKNVTHDKRSHENDGTNTVSPVKARGPIQLQSKE